MMSSDLDRYESFYVVGWLGDFYRIGMGDRMMEIPSGGLTIRTLILPFDFIIRRASFQ